MTDFVKELAACRVEGTQLPFYLEKVQGYTEQEVELIAKNLNLDIHGQFRDFLLQIGKCSGGLLWSDEFYMYDYRCEKDFFINYQKNIQEHDYMFDNQGELDPVGEKIFFLSCEYETYLYYLFTS
ncbi:TPA: SMI1/KNR4 family protein, partial [Acinetobacter baumannii]|nr:SMI1/KNR4 family protein [Acinetobacter baumannii]